MFQSTWLELKSTSWDDHLSSDIQKAVNDWWSHSPTREIWFPRSITSLEMSTDTYFHVFCDASTKAYCAVIYCCHGGEPTLVMAKSRLAPLSPKLTVPRLELVAALIGVRLMRFVSSAIGLESPRVVYWTDSMDVLYWIRRTKPLKVFVENRVREICRLSSVDQWRHIEGSHNPADLGTRGITLLQLHDNRDWWNGPSVLKETLSQPKPLVPVPSAEGRLELRQGCARISPEMKACAYSGHIRCQEDKLEETNPGLLFDLEDCATLKQAVHRMAWVIRFCHNARHSRDERHSGALNPDERKAALNLLIRAVQGLTYCRDMAALQNGSPPPPD